MFSITHSITSKVVVGFVALAFLLSLGVATPASAQTTAELQAQVASLQALISSLQAQLAALSGGSTAGTACYVFARNLSQGMSGDDVMQLQKRLNANAATQVAVSGAGSPGNETSFFGPATHAAVIKYQNMNAAAILTPVGLTAGTGYVGPSTRAHLNANCTTATPTPTTPTTPSTGITTPGVEGTLTVSLNPTPGSGTTVREGDTGKDVLGIKLEAQYSDISVERVKIDLGSAASAYTKVFKTLHVKDGSKVLASVDLTTATVVKEGSNYYVTITGFGFIVPKNTTKVLTIAADFYSSIKASSAAGCDGTGDSCTLTVAVDGVRGTDGAGINQYGPATAFSRSVTVAVELSESASLVLSLNTGTPKAADVVAAGGSDEDEKDEHTFALFDLKAEKDDVLITDFIMRMTGTGGSVATTTTAYLYDGSTLIGSATVDSNGYANFSDIDYTVPKDTTKVITVKADIRDASASTAATIAATASSTGITAENSKGSTVTASGSATGNNQIVRKIGPEFTLLSKSITKSSTAPQAASSTAPNSGSVSTSTALATFTVRIKAVGGDINFGTKASSSPMVATTTTYFQVYRDGAALGGSSLLVASSTSFDTPSSGVVTSGHEDDGFLLQEGNTIEMPLSFRFEGRTEAGALVTGGSYAVGLEGIAWKSSGGSFTSTFMDGLTDWRSSTVSLP
jgi:hypothetical protein